MRGKKAKQLRALCESLTVGKPDVVHVRSNHDGSIRLAPYCTRYLYQMTKRRLKLE